MHHKPIHRMILCFKTNCFSHWIIFLLFTMCLSSCSQVRRKDGPPHFYVNTSKISNAVPKVEPLSRYGNKPYCARGNRYYVLKSSKHYTAIGVASWYGTQFHRQRTSSGELYNMLAMTAAHKTLPLPTYVEVMNLKNHRKVIVKINDRGPFKHNRLIDLSYVAAKKLDMIKHGTAMVKITAIDPKKPQKLQHPHHFRKKSKKLNQHPLHRTKMGKNKITH